MWVYRLSPRIMRVDCIKRIIAHPGERRIEVTPPVWMSTEQVAERFGVGRAAVLAWRANGRIKGVKFGRCWRFALEEIERFEHESAEATTA